MTAFSVKIHITPQAEEQMHNRKLAREHAIQVVSGPEETVAVSRIRWLEYTRARQPV
jgi:hypothetical protein